jgi:alpha-amylase/alpha-mannosidase (GH57 family)
VTARFCLHGHFYQPAREHPWLDTVEVQDSAAPAHDWNERITAECYAANAAARVLDDRGRIVRVANNYEAISFNFGPTLARWLERHAPSILDAVVAADRRSRAARGFGNAIAQAYNHPILPLAAPRDRLTQVRWGIADFTRRFGRPPEGFWLPETAADNATLAALAECGIKFTLLAPHQAARVRPRGRGWTDVGPGGPDVTRAYLCRPAPNRAIALFFYNGPIAQAIAFGRLLDSGEGLAGRLLEAAGDPHGSGDRLVHVATDGETYGHHHRFGEMALAVAIDRLESRAGGLTNYAAFLAGHPPADEVEIRERTSWSCAHGVERWRADCGCRMRGDWHQRWRAPLRDALDWLKDELDALFDGAGAQALHDPWAARDAYIDVVLDRSAAATDGFLAAWAHHPGRAEARTTALRLLEMQRHAMLMFTSDGWFFDDISGIETVQVLRHAARAVQFARRFGPDLEPALVARLRAAESNVPAFGDGAGVYDRLVRPEVVDARRVTAHAAMLSLFTEVGDDAEVYAYRVARRGLRRLARGPHTLATGRAEVTEAATGAATELSYAVLHLGGSDVHCAVAAGWDAARHGDEAAALAAAFEGGTIAEVVRRMDAAFGRDGFTLRDLFLEERRRVLARLSEDTLRHLEASYRRLYQESRGLMEALRRAEVPVPREFRVAAEFVVAADVLRALAAPEPLPEALWTLLAEAQTWDLALPAADLEQALRARIERGLRDADGLFLTEHLHEVLRTLDFARDAGITPNLWAAQTLFALRLAPRLAEGDADVRTVLEAAAERLGFSLDALRAAAPP